MAIAVMQKVFLVFLVSCACAENKAVPRAAPEAAALASKAAALGGAPPSAPTGADIKEFASKAAPPERVNGQKRSGQWSSQYPPPPPYGHPPPFTGGYGPGNHMEYLPSPHLDYPPHYIEYPPPPHMPYPPPPYANYPPPHMEYPPDFRNYPLPYGMNYAPVHHAPPHGMPHLPRAHLPQGGVVTKAELTYMFPMIDANNDGKASVGELQAFNLQTAKSHAQSVGRIPPDLDSNKDGKMSLEELRTANDRLGRSMPGMRSDEILKEFQAEEAKFEQADLDKNGLLEGDELVIFFNPDLDHDVSLIDAKYMLERMDKDQDGLLSKQEFHKGGLAASFGQVDKDKDGSINLPELHHWATGVQDLLWSILHLLKVADKDDDSHLSLSELIDARQRLYKSGGDHYLRTWADVHNEL